jgi:amino acid permease
VCGWSYWFARAISFALQLVVVQNIMATWVEDEKYRYVWIAVFFVLIVLFNVLNVRRFGEIEYWMTVIKIVTIVGIIILGFLLPMGVSTDTRQLATIGNDTAPCPALPARSDRVCTSW